MMFELQNMINSNKPVLIDFYTQNCGPCNVLNHVLDDLKQDLGDKIEIVKVDIDKEKATTINFDSAYQIMGTPTMLLFKDGKLVWKYAGVLFKDDLLDRIGNYINKSEDN